MDRPDRQNYQNQNAHQNLHTRWSSKSSQRPETFIRQPEKTFSTVSARSGRYYDPAGAECPLY
jgi:hypothetical protein